MKEPFFEILEKLGNIHSLQNPFFPEEYIQKHFVFAIGGIQEMSRKNPKSPSEADKLPARKRRPGSIMLNILIVILLVSGLYLIFEPIVGRWRQDNCIQQLLQNFDEGDATIVIGYDEFIVAGEEYDYYEIRRPKQFINRFNHHHSIADTDNGIGHRHHNICDHHPEKDSHSSHRPNHYSLHFGQNAHCRGCKLA